jgi:glycosyltransferase involved in cell wall biosynthesis
MKIPTEGNSIQTGYLPGDYLFIAGSDLYNRLNQPSQHMPYHLARHLEQLDLVGYVRFYDGPPAPAWKRIAQGLRNVIVNRVRTSYDENIRTITARRLRLPGSMDPRFQDFWLYMIIRPYLKHRYLIGIVDGPESAYFAKLLMKTNHIQHLIYYDIDYYPGVHPQWAKILSRREKLLCNLADASASVSRPLAELRARQGSKTAAVIPNGVNFTQFHAANLIRKEHPPTLIYTGSLDERWGVDLAVRAMPTLRRHIPAIQLLIAGRGPAEPGLKELAQSLEVTDCVHFEGFISHANLPDLLAQADIGIATSRQDRFRWYASPLKIVEYMAAGLPVLCSGGGEAEKMIEESRAGINIPFEVQAFVEAVQAILAYPIPLYTYREAAVNYARGRSWEQMGLLMAQLVSRVTGAADQPINSIREHRGIS